MANGKPGRPSYADVVAELKALRAQVSGTEEAAEVVAAPKARKGKGKATKARKGGEGKYLRWFNGKRKGVVQCQIFAGINDDTTCPPNDALKGLLREWATEARDNNQFARFVSDGWRNPRWFGPEALLPEVLRNNLAAYRKANDGLEDLD